MVTKFLEILSEHGARATVVRHKVVVDSAFQSPPPIESECMRCVRCQGVDHFAKGSEFPRSVHTVLSQDRSLLFGSYQVRSLLFVCSARRLTLAGTGH